MPKQSKDSRAKIKVHVYLNSDALEEIQSLFPKLSLSEIVRHALDRLIEKAKEKQKEILTKEPDPNVP